MPGRSILYEWIRAARTTSQSIAPATSHPFFRLDAIWRGSCDHAGRASMSHNPADEGWPPPCRRKGMADHPLSVELALADEHDPAPQHGTRCHACFRSLRMCACESPFFPTRVVLAWRSSPVDMQRFTVTDAPSRALETIDSENLPGRRHGLWASASWQVDGKRAEALWHWYRSALKWAARLPVSRLD